MSLKRKKSNSSLGQAVVEYLVVFGFISIFAMLLMKNFSGYMSTTFGNMAFVLQQHLSVGVCKDICWQEGYGN
jgi:hypothetical protein